MSGTRERKISQRNRVTEKKKLVSVRRERAWLGKEAWSERNDGKHPILDSDNATHTHASFPYETWEMVVRVHGYCEKQLDVTTSNLYA